MKKISVAVLCFIMIFAFCSCGEKDVGTSGKEANTSTSASSGNASSEFTAKLMLSATSSTVTAGDEVTVTLNISDAKNLACFDVYIAADGALECIDYSSKPVPDFTFNIADEADGKLKLSGYTMYTCDFDGEDVCEVKYKIPDSAKTGDEFRVVLSPIEFQSGTDKGGATLVDITDSVTSNELVLTVQ